MGLNGFIEEAKEMASGRVNEAIELFRKWIDTDPSLAEQVYGQDIEELFDLPEGGKTNQSPSFNDTDGAE